MSSTRPANKKLWFEMLRRNRHKICLQFLVFTFILLVCNHLTRRQRAKKVVSDSPGLSGQCFWFLTCRRASAVFWGKFKLQKDCYQSCQSKRVLGLVEMTCGLVHAIYSLPEWQAVKLTFFAPCKAVMLIYKTKQMDQDDVSYRPAMRPMTIVGYLLTNRELTDHWRICSSQNIGDSYEEANQPVHLFIKINKYYYCLPKNIGISICFSSGTLCFSIIK